ncbi:MAG TPA: bifunctional [glutamate--ammonia ligase]-adenylyl-L-tyrosine phosphorylase/[glutamate--ammonia-ligase] adenylyltransferase [Nitrospiraceae bacterium]|nr:bifunctional [glutamate--ammonia ligase]-adenylyl-L-tyrosine phosphorylase/[glutamate--ammonia-ligase] adenylyltransferase [Nitrospiraceae bacterium]
MSIDKEIREKITGASINSFDPKRAETNLLRFVELNDDSRIIPHISVAARLFSASRFLANYCIAAPEELYAAIKERKKEITKKFLEARAGKELAAPQPGQTDINQMMTALRLFKKRYLLRITLRDIYGETDIRSSMDELTALAEIIISTALQWALAYNHHKYGTPEKSAICLIALGKLGGEELNYSSDIDLLAVYENDDGQTTGILNPSGVLCNRISNHEFYCKVVELFNKLLSTQTGDGIAYRVDLRLRPQGQKGDIALPLKAYRTYYESWGRTWERMMLIRARPVAGDAELGKQFIEAIRPFVWRESIAFSEIDEIKGLKKKIDSTFSRDDVKRGYGGIREAEFFIQTFQLLFGGANVSLRTYRILNAIQALKWMKKVPEDDLTILWDNYLYLRRIEHYLQMKEDLQTHALPSSDDDRDILAREMGFLSRDGFLENLQVRRMQVKSMYNSLLGTREDVHSEALDLLEGSLKDYELTGYLSFRKVKQPDRCIVSLKNIREHMRVFRTMQERSIAREVIPELLELALRAENPDRAVAGLESLLSPYEIKTAHLTAFIEQKELMTGIIKILSMSPYLTRIFLSNQYYLDMLIEEWSISKTLRAMEVKLKRLAGGEEDITLRLARYRRFEEVRLGMFFLLNILKIEDLFKGLSQVAEAIIKEAIHNAGCRDLSVIALGKLGAREMTFGSDLDIVFVSESPEAMTAAERIIRTLTSYTGLGLLYRVDTRLRPDGSKGILVNNIEGYSNYYLKKAHHWEIQALLKARPVGGASGPARAFIHMAKDIILKRGHDVTRNEITAMRSKIIKELTSEAGGTDIKLRPGGVEEIEFHVQFLQLNHAHDFPEIFVQNTLTAINRLAKKGLLSRSQRDTLSNTYRYYRKLQTFLRLNEEDVISNTSDITEMAASYMGHTSRGEFLEYLTLSGNKVLDVIGVND